MIVLALPAWIMYIELRISCLSRTPGDTETMIVFAIAFGLEHLRKLFQRALPSLLTPGNLPAVAGEEPELFICTRNSDVPHIASLINESGAASVFGKRISVGMPPPELESFNADNPDPAIAAHRTRSL